MTHLIHVGSGRRVRLGPLTTVGRAPVCGLSLGTDAVSRFHALVFWSERDDHAGWAVRDLHSRNGTFVDGRAIHPGRDVALFERSAVAFGRLEAAWTLADADRPPVMLVGRRGDHDVRLVGRTLLLPAPEPIAAMVHHECGLGWVLETDEAVQRIEGGQPFFAADAEWRAVLPRPLGETRAVPSGVALVFESPPGDDVGDAPLENPEEDVLDHARWAQQLAKMIATGHFANGYVIAVTGEWGCGKSSCMNFVQHYLDHPPERGGWAAVETIRFNPWWFDPDDKLADRFFEQFQASLAESTRVSSGLKQAINALFEALRRRKGHGSPRSIARLKDAVRRCARPDGDNQPERILMVIDDLDRLSTPEIREVFRLVKSVADFPGIVYVLCYDVDVVRTSLDDVIANQKGGAYLEKLVQMSLPVPTPTPSARRRLFDSRIERHAEQAEVEGLFSSTRLDGMFSKGLANLLQTPRRVKRLFDVVDARYPGLSADVDLVDFVGLMALRESVPKAYDHIRQRPDDFQAGSMARFMAGDSWVEAVEGRIATWSSELPEATAEAAKHVLRSLFPGFPKVPMGMPDPSDGERYRFQCNSRSLRRALALDLEPGDLGRTDCRRLVDPSRSMLTEWILSDEQSDAWVAQARELLWYLNHGEDSFDHETRVFIIRAFFRSGEAGWGRFGGDEGLPLSLFERWLSEAESPPLVANLCRESSPSWCCHLTLAACWAYGLYTPRGDESSPEYAARHPRLGSREDAEQLRKMYLDRIKVASSSKLRLLYKPAEHIYAHLWLDGDDGMCRFAKGFADEEGVVSFLQWFIPYDKGGVPVWKLDDGVRFGSGQRYFAELLQVLPDLPRRLSELAPDGPTGDTQELVKRLRAWLATTSEGT